MLKIKASFTELGQNYLILQSADINLELRGELGSPGSPTPVSEILFLGNAPRNIFLFGWLPSTKHS